VFDAPDRRSWREASNHHRDHHEEPIMASTQPRHDDIIIARRFGERALTHTVAQLYAATYPGHTDQGTERESYDEAEKMALKLAKEHGVSVWYEENPQSGRRTLVQSFRGSA
jgi:hypothetical protein